MSIRKYRRIPDDLYKKVITDETLLASQYYDKSKEKEGVDRLVETARRVGKLIDNMNYLYVIHNHPFITWDKAFLLLYKSKNMQVSLFDVVRFLNHPLEEKCTDKMLPILRVLQESNDIKSNFTVTIDNNETYMFENASHWGDADDYTKWDSFKIN